MPEAVIVDAVRTPIGRAFKGSLAQLRPDETGAFIVDQLLDRNPDVDPASVEDLICGCGMPRARGRGARAREACHSHHAASLPPPPPEKASGRRPPASPSPATAPRASRR